MEQVQYHSKNCKSCGGTGHWEVSHDPYMTQPCQDCYFLRLEEQNERLQKANELYRKTLEEIANFKKGDALTYVQMIKKIANQALKEANQ